MCTGGCRAGQHTPSAAHEQGHAEMPDISASNRQSAVHVCQVDLTCCHTSHIMCPAGGCAACQAVAGSHYARAVTMLAQYQQLDTTGPARTQFGNALHAEDIAVSGGHRVLLQAVARSPDHVCRRNTALQRLSCGRRACVAQAARSGCSGPSTGCHAPRSALQSRQGLLKA